MTEGYKKMFWGAMFVSFAGVSGLVALLMTLAGWVIIVAGLGNNDKKSLFGDFSKLRLLTIRLAAVSVTGGVLYLLNHSEMISFAQLRYYPLIHIIIQLIVFHKILEEKVLNFDWMDRIDAARKYASKDRNFTLLMGITIAAFLLFYIFNQPLMRVEGIAAFAASKIYLLWIIYRTKHSFFLMFYAVSETIVFIFARNIPFIQCYAQNKEWVFRFSRITIISYLIWWASLLFCESFTPLAFPSSNSTFPLAI